jgi:hypothetical protein
MTADVLGIGITALTPTEALNRLHALKLKLTENG